MYVKRQAGRLPHWRLEGAMYFITFRLGDAIPARVAQAWQEEIEEFARAKSRRLSRQLTFHELQAIRAQFAGRAEKYLDAGHGSCLLNDRVCRRIVAEAIASERGYGLDSYVVMPNHAHALLHPSDGNELSDILRNIKSFTALSINDYLGREGPLWQRESFDHIVRTPAKHEEFRRYIAENPAKARLVRWHSVELRQYDLSQVTWPNFRFDEA